MWTRREMKNRDPFSGVVELKAKKNKKKFFLSSPTQQKISAISLKFVLWLKFKRIKQA